MHAAPANHCMSNKSACLPAVKATAVNTVFYRGMPLGYRAVVVIGQSFPKHILLPGSRRSEGVPVLRKLQSIRILRWLCTEGGSQPGRNIRSIYSTRERDNPRKAKQTQGWPIPDRKLHVEVILQDSSVCSLKD